MIFRMTHNDFACAIVPTAKALVTYPDLQWTARTATAWNRLSVNSGGWGAAVFFRDFHFDLGLLDAAVRICLVL
jgi:hypothetical protein